MESSSLSESDEKVVDSNGSLRYVDDGIVLAKMPSGFWVDLLEPLLRLVGKSEALRIVGFAFCISFV